MEDETQNPTPRRRGRPRKPVPPNPNPLEPGPHAEAASILGSRSLGVKKTITPEDRERRAQQARAMTELNARKRIAIHGIVVNGDSPTTPPVKPGRTRIQGTPEQQ